MSKIMMNSAGEIKEFDSLQLAYAAGFSQKAPVCEYCPEVAVTTCRTSSGPGVKCCGVCRVRYSKDWKESDVKKPGKVGRPRKKRC
jgi:hypothetical protein